MMPNVHDFKNLLGASETRILGSRGKREERRGGLRRNWQNQVANEGQPVGRPLRRQGHVEKRIHA